LHSFRSLSLAALFAAFVFLTSASAQNVTIVSGNGQVLGGGNFQLNPLVVQVTDATTGNPVGAGVAVNWTGSSLNGVFLATGTNQAQTFTDVNGLATAYFNLPANGFYQNVLTPLVQSTVTATAGGNVATFNLTQLVAAPNLQVAPYIIVVPVNIPVGTTLTGAVGTSVTPPIQLAVEASNGLSVQILPNAAVQLLNFQDPTQGPVIACASSPGAGLNTVLTDANGAATCTPVFGGQPGFGRFVVTVGGVQVVNSSPSGFWLPLLNPNDLSSLPTVNTAWQNFIPINMQVSPGAPGNIKIISPAGGTQSVLSGGSVSLTVETDNTSGLPNGGSTVNWKVVSPTTGGVNLSNSSTTTGTNGQSTNLVTFSSGFVGAAQITATLGSDSTKSVTFTITATPPVSVTQFQLISGSGQSAVANTAFSQPLIVKVSVSAGSAANIPVQFSVFSGSATLSASSANTDANGLAQVNITAGPNSGPVSVVASTAGGPNNVTFALNVLASAPTLTAANFVNGADGQLNSLSPCSLGALVTAPGTLGIPDISPTFPGTPVPSTPIQLTFSNIVAPILSVGTNAFQQQQVLFQVPCEVTPGSAVPVTLSAGGASTNLNLNVQAASPGIFQTKMSDGSFRAVLIRPDGSYVSLTNPARQGEIVVSYVTGLGATTPGVSTQTVPAPSNSPTSASNAAVAGTVVPGMSGSGASLVYAKLSEDLPGVYVVAFQIPTSGPTGNDISYSVSVIPLGSNTPISSGLSKIPVHQ